MVRFSKLFILVILFLLAGTLLSLTPASAASGTKYAVLVGINDYPVFPGPLQYCVNDADDMQESLIDRCGFSDSNIFKLENGQATIANLQNTVNNQLAPLEGTNDTVVFFFSGHGWPDMGSGVGIYLSDGIMYDSELNTLLSVLESNKQALFFDSCFSGGFKGSSANGVNRISAGSQSSLLSSLARSGRDVMTACNTSEESDEYSALRNGLFTYYFLNALTSRSADTNHDGFVSVEESYSFLYPLVLDYSTRAHQSDSNRPVQHAQLSANISGGLILSDLPPVPPPEPVVTTSWYLAEGSSAWGFDTYVNIENPNNAPVTALVTYMTDAGPRVKGNVVLPAMSQTVLHPRDDIGATDFSTRVECPSDKPICVDRRMVWTGAGAASSEGHSSVGVTAPSETWYLPEGSSRWGFETWLLIQNPNDTDASCDVTYMIEGEGPKTVKHNVNANSRDTFSMKDDIGEKDASIRVAANVPVIPERAMYRNGRREGHDSIGTTTPAVDQYLAEGTTAWGFTTYVLVQNPNPGPTRVSVTYMTSDGPVNQAAFDMPANSRKTIKVNDVVAEQDLSTHVKATLPVIAERAMYWDAGKGEACHDSIGMSSPHRTFCLPDGETGNTETWVLVQNPSKSKVTVEIKYLTSTGSNNVEFTAEIPANSRRTFNMAEKLTNGRASALVTCETPIMVERAMYWDSRGAGTDTIGGYSD